MKRFLAVSVCMMALLLASTAFSLTTDPAQGTYESVWKVGSGSLTIPQWSSATLNFDKAMPSGMHFTKAFLKLTGSAIASGLFPGAVIGITAGSNILYAGVIKFVNGKATLALNVAELNKYIRSHHGQISLTITTLAGSITINRAKLSGMTAAPEPLSMALMGAGLLALPFARRLKRRLRNET